MPQIKTCNLNDRALDWAVAKCEGLAVMIHEGQVDATETSEFLCAAAGMPFAPSTDWAQSGPIIERESIAIDYSDGTASENGNPFWCASAYYSDSRPHAAETPLIAAMRCYVASKLGEFINIPEELQ